MGRSPDSVSGPRWSTTQPWPVTWSHTCGSRGSRVSLLSQGTSRPLSVTLASQVAVIERLSPMSGSFGVGRVVVPVLVLGAGRAGVERQVVGPDLAVVRLERLAVDLADDL